MESSALQAHAIVEARSLTPLPIATVEAEEVELERVKRAEEPPETTYKQQQQRQLGLRQSKLGEIPSRIRMWHRVRNLQKEVDAALEQCEDSSKRMAVYRGGEDLAQRIRAQSFSRDGNGGTGEFPGDAEPTQKGLPAEADSTQTPLLPHAKAGAPIDQETATADARYIRLLEENTRLQA